MNKYLIQYSNVAINTSPQFAIEGAWEHGCKQVVNNSKGATNSVIENLTKPTYILTVHCNKKIL